MVMSKDLLERLFWDGERFFWLRSWIIGREPGKPVYLRPGIMSQCHVCCAYDSPSTFGPLRICHHWTEKKQDRRPASADFKCYIHTCIGTVLFITCFSNHWSWASLNLLPLMYIFSTLLSFSVQVLREYLIDFFFQKHSSISLTLTSSWGKTLYEELPVNIWHPKGICSWCGLWGKQRLLRCLCLALTAKQNGARKIQLFPWTRKQKQSADFFFFFEEGHKLFQDGEHRPTSSLSLRKAEGVLEIPRSQTATIIWDEWVCDGDLVSPSGNGVTGRSLLSAEGNLGSSGGTREPRQGNATAETERAKGRTESYQRWSLLERTVHSCLVFREWTGMIDMSSWEMTRNSPHACEIHICSKQFDDLM